MLLPPGCLKCAWVSGFQIPPQEDDYGFDLEEKNKAVVVKSVQRGSLAEVRPTGWSLRWAASQMGVSPCFLKWTRSAGSGMPSCLYGETEPGTSCLGCTVAGNETAFLVYSSSATYWASGDVQGKQKSPLKALSVSQFQLMAPHGLLG